jgi:homoserine/homoserine lactone efflux protein
MALHTWLIYLLAATGLSLTPGPNSLLVLTHGALHGHRKTLFTVAGGAIGFVALIALSMLGIGAVLKASASALTMLKLLGGAYLVWLGIELWRAPAIHVRAAAAKTDTRGAALFRQGLLAAVTNPKALLFYGAFLPQFIDPGRDLLIQSSSWQPRSRWSNSLSSICWRDSRTAYVRRSNVSAGASTASAAACSWRWAWLCQ